MFCHCIIVLLFGLAASTIVIDPVDPVLRSGQSVTFRCQAPSSVESCFWKIDSDLPGNGHGTFENGECSFKLVVPVTHRVIKVECSVSQKDNPQIVDMANTKIIPAVLPKINLRSEFIFEKNDTITAMAGKERKLTCTVAGARPKPDVLWKIGKQ